MNFLRLLGRRSVASILSSLSSMVEQLKAHAEAKSAEADKHHADALRSALLRDEATEERAKALAASDKISNLLS